MGDQSYIYMILEYAPGGDLLQLLQSKPTKRFNANEAARLMLQVVAAVHYCHRMHVMHRDLKPQNFLLFPGPVIKLADFGWAVHSLPGEKRWTLCGTLDYLSPEMVKGVGHGFGIDLWSVGILAFELIVGSPPFSSSSHEETYRRILAASPVFPSG